MKDRLFNCPKCNKQPDEVFLRFKPLRDWMIAYPKDQLIHIHFGEPSSSEVENIKETKFVSKFLDKTIKENSNTQFCLLIDLSTIDDSELVPPESMAMYSKLFNREHIGMVVVYGITTFGMKDVVNLLNEELEKKINIVKDYSKANSLYEKWLNKND